MRDIISTAVTCIPIFKGLQTIIGYRHGGSAMTISQYTASHIGYVKAMRNEKVDIIETMVSGR